MQVVRGLGSLQRCFGRSFVGCVFGDRVAGVSWDFSLLVYAHPPCLSSSIQCCSSEKRMGCSWLESWIQPRKKAMVFVFFLVDFTESVVRWESGSGGRGKGMTEVFFLGYAPKGFSSFAWVLWGVLEGNQKL